MALPGDVLNMTNPKGIIITVTGYTYNPGTVNIKKQLNDPKTYLDFQFYMSEMLRDEFVRAIDKQRFGKKWPPLSFPYYTYKQRKNLSLNIWEATGLLKKEIKVFKKGSYIAVGFRQKDVYPKTQAKINSIAKYVEYGTPKMPARALFRPLTEYMRKHVSDYFKRYQKELKKQNKKYLYF